MSDKINVNYVHRPKCYHIHLLIGVRESLLTSFVIGNQLHDFYELISYQYTSIN